MGIIQYPDYTPSSFYLIYIQVQTQADTQSIPGDLSRRLYVHHTGNTRLLCRPAGRLVRMVIAGSSSHQPHLFIVECCDFGYYIIRQWVISAPQPIDVLLNPIQPRLFPRLNSAYDSWLAHSTRSFGSKLKTLAMRSAFLNDAADKI